MDNAPADSRPLGPASTSPDRPRNALACTNGLAEGSSVRARARRLSSADDVEDVLLQTVGVGLVLDELQLLGVLVRVAEQALARAEQEREDQQVVPVDQAGVREAPVEVALPCMMIGPPSVSFRAATSSSERRMVVRPQSDTRSSSVSVVETTYFGISL